MEIFKGLVEKDATLKKLRERREAALAREHQRIEEVREKIADVSKALTVVKKEKAKLVKKISQKKAHMSRLFRSTAIRRDALYRIDQRIKAREHALAAKAEEKALEEAKREFRKKYRMKNF